MKDTKTAKGVVVRQLQESLGVALPSGVLEALIRDVVAIASRTVTTTAALLNTDDVVFADATAAAFTATLPLLANSIGSKITVMKIGTDVNLVTVQGSGAETIYSSFGEANTFTGLANPGDSQAFFNPTGAKWFAI